MKRSFFLLLIACALLLFAWVVQYRKNTIKISEDKTKVQVLVTNETQASVENITELVIGNTYLYLAESGDCLVFVRMQKDLFNRLKLCEITYTKYMFLSGICEESGKKYMVIGGKNQRQEISRIEFSLEHQLYEVNLENTEDVFLSCVNVSDNLEDVHAFLDNTSLYNSSGEDITSTYDLGSAGI